MISYPRPPVEVPDAPGTLREPRTLRPLQAPPEPLSYPSLPSPPRQPTFSSQFTLSTHIVPAAYPRSSQPAKLPHTPPESVDKKERKKLLAQAASEIIELRSKLSTNDRVEGNHKVLWNCANRYVRKDLVQSKGITLFFAHANGFPKEIWEPTIEYLLATASGPRIDEVWAFEAVQHGDAGLINEGALTDMYDWADHSRDILNFLLNYLPTSPTSWPLPTHLESVTGAESGSRMIDGWTERTFVAVGHSFGGCTTTLAAATLPALFPSLILVDPVIAPITDDLGKILHEYTLGAISRREHWPSREEALRAFSATPFFKAWDPAALAVYVECGLAPDPVRGGVRLKTSGIQEGVMFSEMRVPQETWTLLKTLDERVELKWIVPSENKNLFDHPDELMQRKVWRRPANASNVRIRDAGHLIAQEKPRELGESRFPSIFIF
ncbi:hypothetical protein PLICRDRAFT_173525 [Plicaturopsis crispa FD-325 SS-3]|nr:hypothetical protein PLICRDRAFT_173525 [Plicaturopsis crispa FD-325 SS-3]